MAVPQRIRDEARAAEAEAERLKAGMQPASSDAPPPPAPGNDPVDPPAPPRSLDDVPPGEAPHPNAIDPPPRDNAGGEPVTAESYAALLQQYESLQGINNRNQQQVLQMQGRLDAMDRYLAIQQQAATAAPPAAPAPAPAPVQPLVTEAEIEDMGADLTDFIRRLCRETLGATHRPILDQLQQLQTKVAALSQTTQVATTKLATTEEQAFNAKMDQKITDASGAPDWEKINNAHNYGDNSFVDWLNQIGHDSDETRLAVIQRAYQRKDADTCARLINAYKAEKGLPNGKPNVPAGSTPPTPAASMISPTPVAASNPTRNRGATKTWKLSDIEHNYDDYTKGKYRGKEGEWTKLKAEMDAAAREGRITS